MVEKMRGHIDVRSTVNVGTTFSVVIGSKIKLKQEPKFLNKFQILKAQNEQSIYQDKK